MTGTVEAAVEGLVEDVLLVRSKEVVRLM